MKELKEVSKVTVVVTQTVAEQIIEAPIESVVVVRYPSSVGSTYYYSDSLVKTGRNGYQRARGNSNYLHHEDISSWVNSYTKGAKFFIIEPDN